ncbi:MAG: S4 domain-containing protein [Patescibacteria group bacterium]
MHGRAPACRQARQDHAPTNAYMSEPVRINKYLADHHYCSRREADRLIASGNVFLNNRPAKLGDKVGDADVVRVNGRERGVRDNKLYLMLNKPAGISLDKKKQDTVFDLIDSTEKFFPNPSRIISPASFEI